MVWIGVISALVGVVAFVAGYSASAIKRWIESRADLNDARASQIRSQTATGSAANGR